MPVIKRHLSSTLAIQAAQASVVVRCVRKWRGISTISVVVGEMEKPALPQWSRWTSAKVSAKGGRDLVYQAAWRTAMFGPASR